jgi:hypothetical protein
MKITEILNESIDENYITKPAPIDPLTDNMNPLVASYLQKNKHYYDIFFDEYKRTGVVPFFRLTDDGPEIEKPTTWQANKNQE